MKAKTHKNCKNPNCGKEFKLFRSTDKFCSLKCQQETEPKKEPKRNPIKRSTKPINQVSKKQKVINSKYIVLRIQYLSRPENQVCFVDGCNKKATTIEHRKGRKGFADDWARDNNIPLTLDERFFAPCCLEHNLEFENNPGLSKKYQLSKIHGKTK